MTRMVLSCSLDPGSRSRIMARRAGVALEAAGQAVDWLDLQETPLPPCDGLLVYEDERVVSAADRVRAANGVIVAAPVYNFDLNAAAKNFLELTGKAWEQQVVGFLLAAGGRSSYMSGMGFANSLMLDYRCVIVPRFVYATGDAFDGNALADSTVDSRITELAADLVRIADALKAAQQPSVERRTQ